MTEQVNHPQHYQSGTGIEVILVIEMYGLGFHDGNAVKYLLRAGKKDDRATDFRKALWYLERWASETVSVSVASEEALGWNDPDTIVDAFGLDGDCRTAAIEVLRAACFGNDNLRIGRAIDALKRLIGATE